MDWASVVGNVGNNQYVDRITGLKNNGMDTSSIETTVESTVKNLQAAKGSSFVIFGEPQSGKTEMMIALNARLLDEGTTIIINLLTDSVDLLRQSLDRFRASGLSPSPKQFSELPKNAADLKGKKWVIFSKKNARDLEKLIELLRHETGLMIIDDEADYASPNAKVNKDEKTKINELIHTLLGADGQYIGVTATPARLNLNNTFENVSELWVDFPPHPAYVGQDYFFPSSGEVPYRLRTFARDEGNERSELQNAIMHFMCGVAEQHHLGNSKNFTMLAHTSGKKSEHGEDVKVIQDSISVLSKADHPSFPRLVSRLEKVAAGYGDAHAVMHFVLSNINKHHIVEINSKKDSGAVADIAKPTSLFSFGAGGNIISRGVTFDNLLSMYFTRAVKGKFSQDTYIQRARMFGARNAYKDAFQLWIPDELMANWSKCFEFHKLALQAMRSGSGAPVWLSDHKTTPTSAASIDKSSVDFEGGEMSFGIFDYNADEVDHLFEQNGRSNKDTLNGLRKALNNNQFPQYLFDYLSQDDQLRGTDICFHKPGQFGTKLGNYDATEVRALRRKKGIFSNNEFRRGDKPMARHHLKVFRNPHGQARLFYKINGGSIKFIQNRQ
ncbi:MAG: DNA helicase [Henriciella sp.]|nr:DNA helicase [Henriciella sp.]MBO6694835.1 DNA helicase [Henriciella sp.]